MAKSRLISLILSLVLVLTVAGSFLFSQEAVFAADATPTTTPVPGASGAPAPTPTPAPKPSLTLGCTYPILDANSGQSYAFSVDIKYAGNDKKTFDLSLTAPAGWNADITAGYPKSEVSAVQISPVDINTPSTESVTVNVTPNQGNPPDPGDYITVLKVSSGSLAQSIDLKSVVNATHVFTMSTASGNLNLQITGKQNHFSFLLTNTGAATIDNINLTSTGPKGWVVNFKPEEVKSLGAGQTQQVDAIISPPQGKTIAGDYIITFKAASGTTSQSLDVRARINEPAIWSWASIIIIAAVIIGLAALYMKLGKQ